MPASPVIRGDLRFTDESETVPGTFFFLMQGAIETSLELTRSQRGGIGFSAAGSNQRSRLYRWRATKLFGARSFKLVRDGHVELADQSAIAFINADW